MTTQLAKTTPELLTAKQQQRAEPPAFVEQMSHPGNNAGNRKLVVRIALTIELRIHDPTPSRNPAGMLFGIRMP